MTGDPYVYSGTIILKNKLGLKNASELDRVERQLAVLRSRRGIPSGDFDLRHLKAIHRHLFQDVYEWVGEIRTVEISKDTQQFQFCKYITNGMADVHRRLVADNCLRDLDRAVFATKAGEILGDVNYVHPFREGNGRTQLQYLKQLSTQAGWPIDLRRLDPPRWLAASRRAHASDYRGMADEIARAIV